MTFVAVDEDREEWIYESKPIRKEHLGHWSPVNLEEDYIKLPIGSIKKLIGRELTWDDEPVELKEEKE